MSENKWIDLRSDVVTVAPEEMIKKMSEAEVGDDVYDDDPTANKLQDVAAKYFGFEDSLILPSTTMGNLISVLLWTKPGDEIIVWGHSHLVERESAGLALIGGVQTRQILSESGVLGLEEIKKRSRKASDHITYPGTSLICIENPTFKGEVWPLETLKELKEFASSNDIKVSIDGARIVNALHHYQIPSQEIGKYCDTMTMCLSKGLCCPFGSLLFGSKETIERAKYLRKSLGGGLRQTGIIGAAGLYAFEHIIPKLKQDNENAKYLASELSKFQGVTLSIPNITSNIITFTLFASEGVQSSSFDQKFLQHLKDNKIKVKYSEENGEFRMVLHQGVDQKAIENVIEIVGKFLTQKN